MEGLQVRASPKAPRCVLEQDTLLSAQPRKTRPDIIENCWMGRKNELFEAFSPHFKQQNDLMQY